jgi:hypothetical protein
MWDGGACPCMRQSSLLFILYLGRQKHIIMLHAGQAIQENGLCRGAPA